MEYIKAKSAQPSDFGDDTWYFEIDSDRFETRKVILFSNGQYEWTDGNHETDRTWISGVPMPPFDEMVAQEGFVTQQISAVDFEAVWRKAQFDAFPD